MTEHTQNHRFCFSKKPCSSVRNMINFHLQIHVQIYVDLRKGQSLWNHTFRSISCFRDSTEKQWPFLLHRCFSLKRYAESFFCCQILFFNLKQEERWVQFHIFTSQSTNSLWGSLDKVRVCFDRLHVSDKSAGLKECILQTCQIVQSAICEIQYSIRTFDAIWAQLLSFFPFQSLRE